MREEHQEAGWEDDGGAVPRDPHHTTYTRDQLEDLAASVLLEPVDDEKDPTASRTFFTDQMNGPYRAALPTSDIE
ncbi:MAG: hypothetical protein P4L84_35070 [Isosphaeraceae bacterium]|nr:hypothetical protein [Isosphaeraceae bacterium]